MINYEKELNATQYEAATTIDGPVLVIAGAGSGKTRTIVYRLAHLVESGIPTSSILLLTFTRKAANEMLDRARILLEQRGATPLSQWAEGQGGGMYGGVTGGTSGRMASFELSAVAGGTFHSYAFSILRLFQPEGFGNTLTVMDNHDMLSSLQHCREELQAGKGDRTFPKNQTILGMLSKGRNKEQPLEDIVRRDAHHLLAHVDTMEEMGRRYARFKREKGLLDYDDLLFELERGLQTRQEMLAYCRKKHQYIMVDEYQDTNPVQARIAALIAGGLPGAFAHEDLHAERQENAHADSYATTQPAVPPSSQAAPMNIMVVGDDAQSIYAFRGADVRNILRFPTLFPGTKVIRLEENYRSTQPVLNLCNAVLDRAAEGFKKHLFTQREGGQKPNIIRPASDRSQASIVVARIVELMGVYAPHEIAVLFRSGFHAYHVEIQLNKQGIRFRKFGGIRYAEAAHIKDVMSFVRLVQNPLDFTAFSRMAELSKGIGAKTCLKLYQLALSGDKAALAKATARHPDLAADLAFIDTCRGAAFTPVTLLEQVIDQYRSRLEAQYPDDHPRRMQGLEQLALIAAAYRDLDLFIADLSLDDPLHEEEEQNTITLSTIHSAKGLEWSAVLILDLVEERFPSRHSMVRADDFEEERRLMYVACTRAREQLELFVPSSVFDRATGGSIPAAPSPFVRELTPDLYVEWQEGYAGLVRYDRSTPAPARSLGVSGRASFNTPTMTKDTAQTGSAGRIPRTSISEGFAKGKMQTNDTSLETSLEAAPSKPPEDCGYCTHRVFGRGKIVQFVAPDKYRVNFQGIGLKVIMAAYLVME